MDELPGSSIRIGSSFSFGFINGVRVVSTSINVTRRMYAYFKLLVKRLGATCTL